MKLELIAITKSPKNGKKLRAIFSDGKRVDFGASGYSDYTIHKDDDRKERYINRHRSRENWNDPQTPGALSRYILWNKKTLRSSILDYKKKFGM